QIVNEIGNRRGLTLEAVMLTSMAAITQLQGVDPASFLDDLAAALDELSFVETLMTRGDPNLGLERDIPQTLIQRVPEYRGIIEAQRGLLEELRSMHRALTAGQQVDLISISEIGARLPDTRNAWTNALGKVLETAEAWRREDGLELNQQAVATASNALSELNGLTGAINMVAINAAIEANRLGDQGAGFRVLATEMHRLSDRAGNTLRIARSALEA
ncbi:MAG: methyl-accepting chemotaxis protein, partial [Pseudomonadota bacterium]